MPERGRKNVMGPLTKVSASTSPEFQRPSRTTRSSTAASRQTVTPTPTFEPTFYGIANSYSSGKIQRRTTRASARKAQADSATASMTSGSTSTGTGNVSSIPAGSAGRTQTLTGRKRRSATVVPDPADLVDLTGPALISPNLGSSASAFDVTGRTVPIASPTTGSALGPGADSLLTHVNVTAATRNPASGSLFGLMEPPAKRQRTYGPQINIPPFKGVFESPRAPKQDEKHAHTHTLHSSSAPRYIQSSRSSIAPLPRSGAVEEIDLTEVEDDATINALLRKQQEELLQSQKDPETKRRRLNSFKCIICLDDPTDLAATPCGHMFCNFCLTGALKAGQPPHAKHGKCPVCRRKVWLKEVVLLEIKMLKAPKDKGKGKAIDTGREKGKGKAK